MLLVNELTKRYRQVTALADVSCEFDTGVHGLLDGSGQCLERRSALEIMK